MVWTFGLALALPFVIAPLSCSAADGGPAPRRATGGAGATSATGCEAPATCFQTCNCQTGQTEQCATNCMQSGQVCNGEDCSSCSDCMDSCLCDTGSVTGCIIACGITPSGAGGSESGTGGSQSSGQGGTGGDVSFGGVGGQSGVGGDTGAGGLGGSGQGGVGGVGGDTSSGGSTGTGGTAGIGGSSGTGGGSGVGGTGGSTGACGNDGTSWNVSWQAFECEVLSLTNQHRAEGAVCGGVSMPPVGPLTRNAQLTTAAREHAQDMGDNNYFSHDGLDGSTPFDRIQDAGFLGSPQGENIAAGQRTPLEVVNGWMASSGHCKNIMLAKFKYLGVGYYYTAGGDYHHLWVQNFGG